MAMPGQDRYHPTMRIACPACNAAYDVPPAQLAPGRPVRCARCTETWVPIETEDATPAITPLPEPPRPPPPVQMAEPPATKPLPQPVPLPADDPAPPPDTQAAIKARTRRRSPPVLMGWLITVLVLAELAYVVASYPGPITRTWPAAERAYALFGIHPPAPP